MNRLTKTQLLPKQRTVFPSKPAISSPRNRITFASRNKLRINLTHMIVLELVTLVLLNPPDRNALASRHDAVHRPRPVSWLPPQELQLNLAFQTPGGSSPDEVPQVVVIAARFRRADAEALGQAGDLGRGAATHDAAVLDFPGPPGHALYVEIPGFAQGSDW